MTNDRPLADIRFLMFVGDDYEDLELWYPKLRLAEAGAHVTVAGPKSETVYRGKHSYPCRADASIALMESADFHGLVIPGGFMPDKLRRDDKVKQLVREFARDEKLVAAICHGGWIPISAAWPSLACRWSMGRTAAGATPPSANRIWRWTRWPMRAFP